MTDKELREVLLGALIIAIGAKVVTPHEGGLLLERWDQLTAPSEEKVA